MSKRFKMYCASLSSIVLLLAGCGKKDASAPAAANPTVDANSIGNAASVPNAAPSTPANTAPGPVPTPAAPVILTSTNDVDAVLAQLTRELHRTMIGRKLSGSFDEFVAISHVQVPSPPPGKKFAINKKWRVILVNN